jgi:hypothetical protein
MVRMTKMIMPSRWSHILRAVTVLEEGVTDPGRRIVYNRPVLFNLVITFWVVRSFTDKPNVSNSIEHQLSDVK